MQEPSAFIPLLTAFSHIPVYEYAGTELIRAEPGEAAVYRPPEQILHLFEGRTELSSYVLTSFSAFYGCVKDTQSNHFYILGPVSSVRYTDRMLQTVRTLFAVSNDQAGTRDSWFFSLPTRDLEDFLRFISYFCYALNGEAVQPVDIQLAPNPVTPPVSADYAAQSYEEKEQGKRNNSYYVEMKMLACVENGDLEGLARFVTPAEIGGGTIAEGMLRQMQNIMIVTTSLVSRAAIRGGLDTGTAFRLSDTYILHAERANSVGAVDALIRDMILDYTKRVAGVKTYRSPDPIIFQVVQFIRENVNRPISIGDVAGTVNLSSHYLSTYFKKAMGVDLTTFIRKCRLEEACELLTYTEKTLAEISSYLCFSSQSHFQTVFKKEYGMTPLAYRRSGVSID